MAPKHTNPTRDDRRARAPYNFVPVPDKPIVYPDDERNPLRIDQGAYHPERRSGWIDLEIETRSPVYVRGPLTPDQYAVMERQEADDLDRTPHLQKMRNRPDFFHTGDPDRPAIPGSSLRGMIRTLVEILGHSKFQPVSDVPLVYRAIADMSAQGDAYRAMMMNEEPGKDKFYVPRYHGGYIRHHDGEWYIQPAQEVNGVSFARINKKSIPRAGMKRWEKSKNASHIYVAVSPYEFREVRGGFIHIKRARITEASVTPRAGLLEAVLARSGEMFSKRTEAVIFAPDAGRSTPEEWIRIPDGTGNDKEDLISAYRNQITPEQQRLLGKDGVLQECHPVFYLMDGDKLLFFGHTQMFRVPYTHSPREMLSPLHRSDEYVDLAEMMFGRVRGQSGGEAGRIFVGDATLLPGQDDPWLPGEAEVIPRILSSPKPTTFQHYLTQSRPDDSKGKGLLNYNNSSRQTTLRGYKLYWHKGDVQRQEFADSLSAEEQTKDTQHTRIKPVRSGVRFAGRLYFENLHPVELGLLWWALCLPVEGEHYHKIGMGKPYGLGAVHITPTITIIDPDQRYRSLFAEESGSWQWEIGVVTDSVCDRLLEEAVSGFERFITSKTGTDGAVEDIPRVRDLLTMLSWPGPQPHDDLTRYMEIERPNPNASGGKENEYRERPVLPTPDDVLSRTSQNRKRRR